MKKSEMTYTHVVFFFIYTSAFFQSIYIFFLSLLNGFWLRHRVVCTRCGHTLRRIRSTAPPPCTLLRYDREINVASARGFPRFPVRGARGSPAGRVYGRRVGPSAAAVQCVVEHGERCDATLVRQLGGARSVPSGAAALPKSVPRDPIDRRVQHTSVRAAHTRIRVRGRARARGRPHARRPEGYGRTHTYTSTCARARAFESSHSSAFSPSPPAVGQKRLVRAHVRSRTPYGQINARARNHRLDFPSLFARPCLLYDSGGPSSSSDRSPDKM